VEHCIKKYLEKADKLKVSISVVGPDPYVLGLSDPSLFCTDPDPSIKQQRFFEKH
jgi:hypothetical protein